MDVVTKALRHWLAKNDLPLEGVRIVLEFPNERAARDAAMCIKRETEPHRAFLITGGTFGAIETMNGLALTLAYRQGKTRRQA